MRISDEEWSAAAERYADVERRTFELSDDDLALLADASRPQPLMLITRWEREHQTLRETVQDRVNAAWAEIGERLGFDFMGGVEPVDSTFRKIRAVPT